MSVSSYIDFHVRAIRLIAFVLLLFRSAPAQNPLRMSADAIESRFDASQPVVRYTLTVDSTDLSGFNVAIIIRNAPDTFHLAMATHPEIDDHYFRYVEHLRLDDAGALHGEIIREDSALWLVHAHGRTVTVRYRIQLPPPAGGVRHAYQPFLSPTGGLVGDLHSFMYIVGQTMIPSHLTISLPRSWKIATGLEPTSDPQTFYAPSARILLDCPILLGNFREWGFSVDGVPHHVVYLPTAISSTFDTLSFIRSIGKIVTQCIRLFGRAPYREYTFLVQDGADEALEHLNSLTIGLQSAHIAKDSSYGMPELAHEFFHTWNLMRIRPAEFGDVTHGPQWQSRGLWWSEGLTMFYSDILLRRADLHSYDSSRISRLERLIGLYFGNPGNSVIPAERVSLASNRPPGLLGDYGGSSHLQGELIGALLDMMVRDATNNSRTMDDVMRLVFRRFGGEKGFTSADLEKAVEEVSGKDVHSFFNSTVLFKSASSPKFCKPIEFNNYFRLIGLHLDTTWSQTVDSAGRPLPDLRIFPYQVWGDSSVRILITDPTSCWARSGLHTGMVVTTINDTTFTSPAEFRARLFRRKPGDSVAIGIRDKTGSRTFALKVTGYQRVVAHITSLQHITPRQKVLRDAWLNASN